MENLKTCLSCGSKIKGRPDKLFCDPNCKSAYQYEMKQVNEITYLKVDKQLKTNRKILKKYNRVGMTSLRQEILLKEGFDPNYFTNYWKNQKGDIYLFVYDYGFLKLKDNNKNKYIIVKWQDYMEK